MKVIFKNYFNKSNLNNILKNVVYKTNITKYNFSGCSTTSSTKKSGGCGTNIVFETKEEKTLKDYNNKIINSINQGQYDDALEGSDNYINKLEEFNYDNNHAYYISALNNKAFILKNKGELNLAKEIFEQVIEKYLAKEDYEKVVICKQNLAVLLRDMKEVNKAIEVFEELFQFINKNKDINDDVKVKTKKETIVIKKHYVIQPNIQSNIYTSAAGCYRAIKQYSICEEMLVKSTNIILENYGSNNIPIANIYNQYGLLFKEKGDFDKAVEYYNKGLEIKEDLLEHDHPEVLKMLQNLAQLYLENGNKEKAVEVLKRGEDSIINNKI